MKKDKIHVTIETASIVTPSKEMFGVYISYEPSFYNPEDDEVYFNGLYIDEEAKSLDDVKKSLEQNLGAYVFSGEYIECFELGVATERNEIERVVLLPQNIKYTKEEWKAIAESYWDAKDED